jgi:GMP synthase PP-ATPase subunit
MSNARTFDRGTVEHVAKLAALSLSSDEAERFTTELAAIVAHEMKRRLLRRLLCATSEQRGKTLGRRAERPA